MYRIFSIIDNRFRAGIAGYAVLSPHRAHVNACQRVYLSSVMILVTFLWNATIDGSISLLPEVAPGRPCSPFSSANIETILRLISGDDTNVFAIETCSPFFFIKEEGWVNKKKKKKISWRLYHFPFTLCSSSSSCNEAIKRRGREKEKETIDRVVAFLFPLSHFFSSRPLPARLLLAFEVEIFSLTAHYRD